jgi:hypothetical protein
VRRHQLAVGCGVLVLGLAAPHGAYGREAHLELEGGADVHVAHYFHTHPLALWSAPRSDSDTKLPSVGPLTLGGVGADFGVSIDERIIVPILGFGFETALGQSPRVLTGIDGALAEVRPWTAWKYDIGMPGLGLRFKERRWMFSFLLRPGISLLFMKGSVAAGADTNDLTLYTPSLYARAEVEACRRFDPTERVCVFVAPTMYVGFGFVAGASAGVRWEIGP